MQNAEELLETEAQNLRAVRATHAASLKERTELEVFLLQSILFHRQWKEHKIAEGALARPHGSAADLAGNTQSAELVFTAEDRRRVVERLLSQDRVIRLLYGGNEEGEADAALPSLQPSAPSSASTAGGVGRRRSSGTTPQAGLDDGGGLADGSSVRGRPRHGNLAGGSSQGLGGAALGQDEVGQLWEKWRLWTKSAQSVLRQQHAAENEKD